MKAVKKKEDRGPGCAVMAAVALLFGLLVYGIMAADYAMYKRAHPNTDFWDWLWSAMR